MARLQRRDQCAWNTVTGERWDERSGRLRQTRSSNVLSTVEGLFCLFGFCSRVFELQVARSLNLIPGAMRNYQSMSKQRIRCDFSHERSIRLLCELTEKGANGSRPELE